MLAPALRDSVSSWSTETASWLENRLAKVNAEIAAIKSVEMADIVEADIRQFIGELEVRKREVNQKITEVRNAYNSIPPRQAVWLGRGRLTKDMIELEKAKFVEILRSASVSLDSQISEMNHVIVEMERQIHAQTGGRDAVRYAREHPAPSNCPNCGSPLAEIPLGQTHTKCIHCDTVVHW